MKIKNIISVINSNTSNNLNDIDETLQTNATLSSFNTPTSYQNIDYINSMSKSDPHDPLPLSLFKSMSNIIVYYFLYIIKSSFINGKVDNVIKHDVITP